MKFAQSILCVFVSLCGLAATAESQTVVADDSEAPVAGTIAYMSDGAPAALALSVCSQKRVEIKRRGRVGNAGQVTNYFTPSLRSYSSYIINHMEGAERVGNTLYVVGGNRDGYNINNVPSGCVFGFGSFGKSPVNSRNGRLNPCLDPFFTVAADRHSGLHTGDVLFIESLTKKIIGRTASGQPVYHPGCVVVKDVGSKIKGRHIDFFTGLYDAKNYNRRNDTCRNTEPLVSGLSGSHYFVLPQDLASQAVAERQNNFQVAYHSRGANFADGSYDDQADESEIAP